MGREHLKGKIAAVSHSGLQTIPKLTYTVRGTHLSTLERNRGHLRFKNLAKELAAAPHSGSQTIRKLTRRASWYKSDHFPPTSGGTWASNISRKSLRQ